MYRHARQILMTLDLSRKLAIIAGIVLPIGETGLLLLLGIAGLAGALRTQPPARSDGPAG